MDDRPQTMMGDCHDKIDDIGNGNGVSRDGDYMSLQKGDEGSNNSATASISSSSSLTSSDDNNATSSSMSTSSYSSKSNEFDEKNLWWIHGKGYDLMEFVKNHPGGVEAILLGKGRDCTALVESYHAFSGERVWKVLEKYRFPTGLPEDEDEGETDEFETVQGMTLAPTEHRCARVPDFFYEVLKKRVTKVLHSKGINPVKDRGASKTRIAYYLVVLVSWLYAGYLHCSVSFFYCCYRVMPRHILRNSFCAGTMLKIDSHFDLSYFLYQQTNEQINHEGQFIGIIRVCCHWMANGRIGT
jgi:hypothetical protein